MSSESNVVPVRVGSVSEEDYLSCTRCGACSYACPVYRVELTQSFSPRGRVALLRTAGQGEAELSEGFGSRFYDCTLCAACTETCPSGVKVDELLLKVRQELASQGRLTTLPRSQDGHRWGPVEGTSESSLGRPGYVTMQNNNFSY